MNRIYAVGIGPGSENMMTAECRRALEDSDVIVGYPVYLGLLPEEFAGKKQIGTPMRKERERCQIAIQQADLGLKVAVISSGDAGVYGMAALLYEMTENSHTEIVVVPGITAALSGAAKIGSPLSNDFCVVSLSDALTPWEVIEKRLRAAAEGEFALAIYNPQSKTRKDYMKRAAEILYDAGVEKERPAGYVKNIEREGETVFTGRLYEVAESDIDMFTTVFVGSSVTKLLKGKLVTPRGYK